MTEPTDAEIEAAAQAGWGDTPPWDLLGPMAKAFIRERVAATLTAALPLIEARLREQIAAEIAEIVDEDGPDTSFWHGTLAAVMVARGATHRNGRALVDEWFDRRGG